MSLTLERLMEVLSYNSETGLFTWRIKPGRKAPIGSVAGAIGTKGYRRIRIDSVRYNASRLAWLYAYGKWPSGYIDHINGLRTDDRLCNLRTVNAAESSTNRKGWSSTGIKGVHKRPNGAYWAKIKRDGKVTYLGTYATLNEAAAARKRAALVQQGAFAFEARS